jgi:isopenicillin-N epimerase
MAVSDLWLLDPEVDHLNHGSFGACPRPVLAEQQRWRHLMERNPVRFMLDTYPDAIDTARRRLAEFLGADPDGLVFVPNATSGVNAVLRSLEPDLGPGDEILITDHSYNACRNAAEATALRTDARVVVAVVPFPVESPTQVLEAVLAAVTPRTRLALIDHVTSPTALVLPVDSLVRSLEPEVRVLIDGAHAPGMVEVDLGRLGASFAVGNCHKWLCAPKGAGYLYVAADQRERTLPVTISHGWRGGLWSSRSRFHSMFDWTGTDDPSAWLSVPAALDAMGGVLAGGWAELMAANRERALLARRILAARLRLAVPAPEEMIGAMASLPLPGPVAHEALIDPLTLRLREAHRIEVPVFGWSTHRLLRISAQHYNHDDQYQRLASVLQAELAAEALSPPAPAPAASGPKANPAAPRPRRGT